MRHGIEWHENIWYRNDDEFGLNFNKILKFSSLKITRHVGINGMTNPLSMRLYANEWSSKASRKTIDFFCACVWL